MGDVLGCPSLFLKPVCTAVVYSDSLGVTGFPEYEVLQKGSGNIMGIARDSEGSPRGSLSWCVWVRIWLHYHRACGAWRELSPIVVTLVVINWWIFWGKPCGSTTGRRIPDDFHTTWISSTMYYSNSYCMNWRILLKSVKMNDFVRRSMGYGYL